MRDYCCFVKKTNLRLISPYCSAKSCQKLKTYRIIHTLYWKRRHQQGASFFQQLAEMEYDAKSPIIFECRLIFVKIFVGCFDCPSISELNYGLSAAINQLEFAILNLRAVLHTVEDHCFFCRESKAKTIAIMMAELPVDWFFIVGSP